MIPKIFHQIWLGDNIPDIKAKWLTNNAEKLIKEGGWTIKFWGNDSLTKENFPIMWPYIQKAIKLKKPFAMVTDLARYEIVYRYGGVYMDVNLELQGRPLENMIKVANKKNKTLIIAHENKFVHALKASINTNKGERKYTSNGFFAATKKNPVLKNALKTSRLDKIDWENEAINEETGPFYWRESMTPSLLNKIHVLKTEYIYPMSLYETFNHGNGGESDNKCISKKKTADSIKVKLGKHKKVRYLEIPCKKYKNSYSVDHFNFGGTWH
tara:strand:+ start:416 stop:1222 length:807 start_codon:yes stop_codon:yes gene_type:complete